MSNIEVVGLGALNIDHLYRVERIVDDGEAVAEEAESLPGGSAANTVYGLAMLGVKAGFAGVVGDDAEGKMLREDFERVGVDTSQIAVKRGARTGSVLCLSDGSGKRSLYVSPGANSLLAIDDLDLDYINQASVLHVSSFVDDKQLEMLLELIDRLNSSVKLSFAPGALYTMKGLKALAPILGRTYVLFINLSEIEQLTGQDFSLAVGTCLKQGCQIVAVTLGRGTSIEFAEWLGKPVTATAYIKEGGKEYMVPANVHDAVSPVDITGAGDAFAAGFLCGLLGDKGLEECGRLGDIVAQFSISKLGARQGLPTPNELSQRYQELYPEKR